MKVVKKDGIYFKAVKYRKRKLLIALSFILVVCVILYNKFLWNIEVIGNEKLQTEEILNVANNAGLHIATFKPKLDTNYVIKCLKRDLPELAWIGVDVKGTKLIIRVVEKTTIPEDIIYDKSKTGDIVAKKSGVLTKIVAENGTIVHQSGSYVEKDMVLIKGVISSEILGDTKVRASGIVKMNVEYEFEKEYSYEVIEREYLDKNKYSIGISVNDKEFYINYLNKSKKYDTLKSKKEVNLFGIIISFDFYKFIEYNEINVVYTYDELLEKARAEKEDYIKSVLLGCGDYVSEREEVFKTETGIKYKSIITINENGGIFKGD